MERLDVSMGNGINLNVILVGSNPLPCYIQAAYALKGGEGVECPDYIMFVSTEEGSETYVENIKETLVKNRYDIEENFKKFLYANGYDIEGLKETFKSIESDVKFDGTYNIKLKDGYEASAIESVLKDKLEKLQGALKIRSILLNNTGGTKAMAVYATMAVRAFCNNKGIDLTECFVDPQKNKLRCYKNGEIGTNDYPSKGDLRDYVRLEIEQLVYLHYGDCATVKYKDKNGLQVQKKSSLWKVKTEEQQVIARNIISSQTCFDAYKDFFETYESYRGIKKIEERIEKMLQDSANNSVNNLNTILSVVNKNCSIGTKEVIKIITPFLGGKWLEDMFYRMLLLVKEELKEEDVDIDVAWSYEINKKVSDVEQKEFEVDILVLRGYELTIFSVSMADGASLVKGKWFEVVYRSEQIAGEHGKAALVTFINNQEDEYKINKLKLDLQTFKRDVELYNRESMRDSEQLIKVLKESFRK